MKKALSILCFATLGALLTAACDESADELTGRGPRGAGGKDGAPCESNAQCSSNVCVNGACIGDGDGTTPASLQCTVAPQGRSYVLFDGKKLEETRENENVGVNRARVKPYPTLEKEYQRVLGLVPPSLKGAGGSFDEPPARWFGEAEYSAVSLHAIASISYEACTAYTKSAPEFAAAPTMESAGAECKKLMRKAWSRTPSPDEISACAKLAAETLANETDVRKRWAYACTSVLSATQFLTF